MDETAAVAQLEFLSSLLASGTVDAAVLSRIADRMGLLSLPGPRSSPASALLDALLLGEAGAVGRDAYLPVRREVCALAVRLGEFLGSETEREAFRSSAARVSELAWLAAMAAEVSPEWMAGEMGQRLAEVAAARLGEEEAAEKEGEAQAAWDLLTIAFRYGERAHTVLYGEKSETHPLQQQRQQQQQQQQQHESRVTLLLWHHKIKL